MEKLIITAAICGAEVTKEHNPAVPYTVEEMVREAKSAFEAGAAVIHVHVREDDGTPTQDKERFRVVMDAIKAGSNLVASVGQDPFEMGRIAMENALKILNGETVEEKETLIPVVLITAENVDEIVQRNEDYLASVQ